MLADFLNGARWAEDSGLQTWLRSTRLNPFSGGRSNSRSEADPELAIGRAAGVKAAAEKLRMLLSETRHLDWVLVVERRPQNSGGCQNRDEFTVVLVQHMNRRGLCFHVPRNVSVRL
jgi:hypothetical protein